MKDLSLGIPGVGQVSSGVHFCALYSGPAERDQLLFPFLDEGLRHGDKVLCLIDDVEPAQVRNRVAGTPGPEHPRRSAQIEVERSSDVYLAGGQFDLDLVTKFLSEQVDTAVTSDFKLLRAAGEMSWVMPGSPGCDDLSLYESALNRIVSQEPAIFMCLYDLTKFGADMLVEVLHTHPSVLIDRAVIDNPYYVAAEDTAGDEDACDGWGALTHTELRVASHVSQGMTNRMIAADLFISRHTVDAHLKHIYLKLDIHSRVELTVLALRHRLAIA